MNLNILMVQKKNKCRNYEKNNLTSTNTSYHQLQKQQ